ncbi:hypothetical protein DFH08DRAFT_634813, partial [Mycena albidolilacea]
VKTMTSVKLLGVHLDRELRWHQQCIAALTKGEAWLIQTARIARTSRDMRHLYLGVCVPQILYTADLFLSPPACNCSLLTRVDPVIIKKLCSIQCRAALAITDALWLIPTEVLDVYAHLLPVEHLVNK